MKQQRRWPGLLVVVIASIASMATDPPEDNVLPRRDGGTADASVTTFDAIEHRASASFESSEELLLRGDVVLTGEATAALGAKGRESLSVNLKLETPQSQTPTQVVARLSLFGGEGSSDAGVTEARDEVALELVFGQGAEVATTLRVPLDLLNQCVANQPCARPFEVRLLERNPASVLLKGSARVTASVELRSPAPAGAAISIRLEGPNEE